MPLEKEIQVALVGYRGIGKSTIATQLVENCFMNNYYPTIEHNFYKTIVYKKTTYKTNILDTAGQDEFSPFSIRGSFGVDGYAMIYSVAHRPSFTFIPNLNAKISTICGPIPRILVGNKCDLQKDVSTKEGREMAQKLKCPFIECSAKYGEQVSDVFTLLIAKITTFSTPLEKGNWKCILF